MLRVHHIVTSHVISLPVIISLLSILLSLDVFTIIWIYHFLLPLLLIISCKKRFIHVIVQCLSAWLSHGIPVLLHLHWHSILSIEELLLILLVPILLWLIAAHHAWVRSEIIVHHQRSTRVTLLRVTTSVSSTACHGLTSWIILLSGWLLIYLSAITTMDNADVVSVERLLVRVTAINCDIHRNACAMVIEASVLLKEVGLTLKHGQVVGKHLPIELLSNVLLTPVLLILFLSCIVNVTVERNELVPLTQVLAHVIGVLLTDLQEVLATREVVKHDCSSHFVEQLLLEILTLIK